jgi:hypothetical protein
MITRASRAVFPTVFAASLAGFAGTVYGVDGVILIDQNRALAGNATPGDTPGFPVSITQPGSYRLAGNLTVPNANTTAIEITASDVTIDLNGFSIRGPVTCVGFPAVTSCAPAGSGFGIFSSGFFNIAVHNGTVRGMGDHGIFLTSGSGQLVKNVRAQSNGQTGIFVASGIVSHSTATSNGLNGIGVDIGTISNNSVIGNRANGAAVQTGGTVHHNTAANNGNFGLSLALGAGYVSNVMIGNLLGPVFPPGVSLGGGNHNLCDGVPC